LSQVTKPYHGAFLDFHFKTPRKAIVKTPRKTNTFTKKQNNVQAFVSLHIRPIVLFCRKYFLQEVFVRFYFLVKITAGKASIN